VPIKTLLVEIARNMLYTIQGLYIAVLKINYGKQPLALHKSSQVNKIVPRVVKGQSLDNFLSTGKFFP